MEAKIFAKRNLEIVEIKPERIFGQDNKTLLPVVAKDLSFAAGDPLAGKIIDFVIFISALKEYMTTTPTRNIIVDYEERPSKNPEYGPNRSIQQIYVKGEPVSKKKGGYGKSAEIVRLEAELKARSIEATVAVKEIGLLLRNGQVLDPADKPLNAVIDKYWEVVNLMLDNYLAPKPQKPPARQYTDAKLPSPFPSGGELIKNAGELLTRASQLDPPKSKTDVLTMLSVNNVSEITDLDAAWGIIKSK